MIKGINSKQKGYGGEFLVELRRNKALYVMLFPGLLFIFINCYLPMVGVVVAFKNVNYVDGILKSPWSGFDNFKYLFGTPNAFQITRNTLLYNGTFILLSLLIGVAFAVAINEIKNKIFAKFYQSVMFLPYFLSMVVVSYLLYAFYSVDYGFMNKIILPKLGIEPIMWYSETKYWPATLILVYVWKYIGYNMVVYLAGITSIDSEYYEAAIIDGASKWQQIKNITIPLLKPLMIITTLMAVGRIFNSDFGLFYQVPRDVGLLRPATDVIDTYVYRSLTVTGEIGMASAAGLYQSIVGLVLISLSNFVVKKYSPDNALF